MWLKERYFAFLLLNLCLRSCPQLYFHVLPIAPVGLYTQPVDRPEHPRGTSRGLIVVLLLLGPCCPLESPSTLLRHSCRSQHAGCVQPLGDKWELSSCNSEDLSRCGVVASPWLVCLILICACAGFVVLPVSLTALSSWGNGVPPTTSSRSERVPLAFTVF